MEPSNKTEAEVEREQQRSESEAGGVEHFMQQLLHLSQRITPNVLRA